MEGQPGLRAYKMLERGALGPLSRFRWPASDRAGAPGPWVEAAPNPVRTGIHACRPWQLPLWANDELWEIELGGEVEEEEHSLVALRGRLLRRIDAWDTAAATFSAECIASARRYGTESTAASGVLDDLPPVAAAGDGLAAADSEGGVWWARGVPAAWADIAAVAAEAARGASGRADERARQAAWFEALLG